MRTNYYINGKKVSRKAAEYAAGKERLDRLVNDTKEAFMEDPCLQLDYMVTGGILTIKFC